MTTTLESSSSASSSSQALVRQAVAETWNDYLTAKFPQGHACALDDDVVVLDDWKQTTVTQVRLIYGHHIDDDNNNNLSDQDIRACIDEVIQTWKQALPSSQSIATSTTAAAPKSFSLFSSLAGGGGGGLASFFSWPMIADNDNEDEIWQALMQKMEYLDDVWPDWSGEIRPWIQERLRRKQHQTEQACQLYRAWYDKARRQESPETTQLSLDFMQDIFEAVEESFQTTTNTTGAAQTSLLELGLDMMTDFMVRKATTPPIACLQTLWKVSCASNASTSSSPSLLMQQRVLAAKDPRARWLRLYLQTHPSLYRNFGAALDISLLAFTSLNEYEDDDDDVTSEATRRHRYVLALLSNLLVTVRVRGFPWRQWLPRTHAEATTASPSFQQEQQEHVQLVAAYRLLWAAVRDPATPHGDLYVQGLAALLAGSNYNNEKNEGLVKTFRNDFAAIKAKHLAQDSFKLLRQYAVG